MKAENEKFCFECGEIINAKAEICPKCGVRQIDQVNKQSSSITDERNRWLTCLLLCWFLGPFGAHRFYTGHIGLGILQVLTLGGCGVWALIDLIIIIAGNFKDSEGNIIKNV